jgi:uncharacterized protein
MQVNLLWTGRKYYSLENCLVDITETGTTITSTIIGHYQNKIYKVEYRIRTNENWETTSFEISSRHSNEEHLISFEGDGKGNWRNSGRPVNEFQGCIDIDIPLTPFTNSLPINRIKMLPGDEKEIQVIYLDLLSQEIKAVRQHYRCLSATEYQYENIPNDFEATIKVDENGFVVDYPALFVRSFGLETDY